MGLGGCGIAKLATLWLGKVVEEGGMNIHGGGEDSWDGYVDCQSKEVHSEDRKKMGFKENDIFGRSQGRRPYGENGKSNAQTTESSSQALMAQDGLGGYDWSNDLEIEPRATQAVRSQADKSGQTSQKQGIGFKKVHKIKACFVCKSTDHLIKDCDFYDQKSPEPRVKNVVNTGKRVVKPVWDYGKRVNHQNFSKNLKYPHAKRTFNPSAVLTRAGLVNTDRSNVSTARSISTVRPVRPVSTARPLASKIAQSNSVIRPYHPRLDIVRPKASNSPIKRSYFTQPVYRPKDLKPDVKTFGVNNMTIVGTRAVVSKGKVENVLKKDKWGNPEILLQDHAVVDSGCSSHMTGNRAYLLGLLKIHWRLCGLLEGKLMGNRHEGYVLGTLPLSKAFRELVQIGCQFLGRRLISWQCKKQTIVANSTTEAEYVAAAHCCRQNQALCIRHHFIRDCYEKRLIDVLKIHTDSNVADLLTKGFDVTRISMDLRMDRCSAGKFYSSMVNSGSLQVNSGRLLVNSVDLRLILMTVGAGDIVPLLPAYVGLGAACWINGEGLSTTAETPSHTCNTSGSAEDSVQLKELMVLVPKLVTRINSLEKELKDTKQTLGNVVLKLVKNVKTLETALKRKSKKVLISESEGEESEEQGRKFQDIDDDPLVSLVQESMKEKSTDFVTPTKALGEAHEEEIRQEIRRRRARSMAKKIDTGLDARKEVNTGREKINNGIEEVSAGSTKIDSGTASKRSQREGKAPIIEEDIQATHKTKEQLRQEEARLEEAIKLQAQLDEDEEATHKRKLNWMKKLAKLEANAELSKDVLGQDLPEQDFAKRMVDMVNQRKKHFAEERAKAKRNKPMTQSQTSKKQRIDDKDVPAIGEKVAEVKEEEQVKRTGKRKKQKARKGIHVDKSAQEDSETDKEELVEAMNPTPLTTKSDSVANWKIFQQGQRSVYQIIRANGADTVYMSFGAMIKDFTREDLIELY
ncbi:hypothetical protein Tco_1046888, partial [Tanacetum coccineum]